MSIDFDDVLEITNKYELTFDYGEDRQYTQFVEADSFEHAAEISRKWLSCYIGHDVNITSLIYKGKRTKIINELTHRP